RLHLPLCLHALPLAIVLTTFLIRISVPVITSRKDDRLSPPQLTGDCQVSRRWLMLRPPPHGARPPRKKELLLRIEEASSGGSIRTAAEAF
ncbi:hypothetical protein K523DRAFT_321372, partial [Schizophyllum commune Tattone D]